MLSQISDGIWENSQPFNHCEPWVKANACCQYYITKGKRLFGNTVNADRRDYDFEKKILNFRDCIMSRMLVLARLFFKI